MTKYESCLDDVKKLKGLPPYGFNPCIGDGYFYESLKKKYTLNMLEKAFRECNEIQQKINELCGITKEEKIMELKTVEEYSKEMTRKEFDKFTEEQELCPSSFGLLDAAGDVECSNDCFGCWNDALVGIEFKAEVPGLPIEVMPALQKLQDLEIQAKSIKEQQEKLKEDLLNAMETHGVKKWDNEVMTITYTSPTTRTSIDSSKLKKELPDVFSKYSKTSNVKSSIRIKLKGDK